MRWSPPDAVLPPDAAAGRIEGVTDILRSDPALDGHPLVLAAQTLADELFAPGAAAVDAGQVPRSHLDALGAAGLLGLQAPVRVGGAQAPPAVVRRVEEVLAGADLATWFVQAQHHSPVRALAASGAFDPVLTELAAGRQVAGIAFSHLRHWPRRPLTATRTTGGWQLEGAAPWYTGWGVNDVVLVSGVSESGDAVHGLVAARPAPGLSASVPIDVVALRAALTVALAFDRFLLPDDAVVSVQPIDDWLAADRLGSANSKPAVFGLAASALRLLADAGHRRGEGAAVDAADRMADRLRTVRDRAYALLDDPDPASALDERLRLRAASHQVLMEATTGLVVAGAGGSMAAGAPAQRKAREALFLLVQAQTAASRRANLEALGQPDPAVIMRGGIRPDVGRIP
jgi:alkylation response protein AidB-like acyl-CoA dehydrogenase